MNDIPAKDAPFEVKAAYLGENSGFQINQRLPGKICEKHHLVYEDECLLCVGTLEV